MFTRLAILCALVGALFTCSASMSQADTASDIKALQAAVKTLQSQVSALQSQNTSLQSQVNSLKSVTSGFTRVTDTTRTDGKKGTELFLTGFNLHVVNGLGATSGNSSMAVNGLGNVTIGYNAKRGGGNDIRTGSHNLVVGDAENYSSFGGVVFGAGNAITGTYACVSGGYGNMASANITSISGGSYNTASGTYASVSGGSYSTASGEYDSTASGALSAVSGGGGCTADGAYSSVSGGSGKTAPDTFNWAAGRLSQDH